jgi:NNP family nitrate/nitrite transporter-like MFS transporter
MYLLSSSALKGNYSELKKNKSFKNPATITSSFTKASWNRNTWILFWQYACSFGVELTMNNAAALYFRDEFDQSVEAAAAIASIFGWLNFFARGLGGFFSDAGHNRWGMKGRLWVNIIFMLLEGALVLVFASTSSLAAAIMTLVLFSLCVQAAEGTNFAIVPYVDPLNMGSVCGIVGAGGNVGAVAFGLGFRELNYENAFFIMGISILSSSLLSIFLRIDGHSGLLWGEDKNVDPETGNILESEEDERQKIVANAEDDVRQKIVAYAA